VEEYLEHHLLEWFQQGVDRPILLQDLVPNFACEQGLSSLSQLHLYLLVTATSIWVSSRASLLLQSQPSICSVLEILSRFHEVAVSVSPAPSSLFSFLSS
jgi:hypothetical protein